MPSLSPRSTLERVTPDRTSTPKPPSTGNPWLGHLGGSRDYRRIQLAMLCAGFATFAQLYAPQALLPEISTTFDIDPATAAAASPSVQTPQDPKGSPDAKTTTRSQA